MSSAAELGATPSKRLKSKVLSCSIVENAEFRGSFGVSLATAPGPPVGTSGTDFGDLFAGVSVFGGACAARLGAASVLPVPSAAWATSAVGGCSAALHPGLVSDAAVAATSGGSSASTASGPTMPFSGESVCSTPNTALTPSSELLLQRLREQVALSWPLEAHRVGIAGDSSRRRPLLPRPGLPNNGGAGSVSAPELLGGAGGELLGRAASSPSLALRGRGRPSTAVEHRTLAGAVSIATPRSPRRGTPWPRSLSAASLTQAAAAAYAASTVGTSLGSVGGRRAVLPSSAAPARASSTALPQTARSCSPPRTGLVVALRAELGGGGSIGGGLAGAFSARERRFSGASTADSSRVGQAPWLPLLQPQDPPLEELRDALMDVFLRVRPAGTREQREEHCVHVRGHSAWVDDRKAQRIHRFDFDDVIDSSSEAGLQPHCGGQNRAYEVVGARTVHNLLDGFNSCILSLGQTGTGKTYTLVGAVQEPGLLPRILDSLVGESAAASESGCRLSCLELHLDRVRDLLAADVNLHTSDRPSPEVRCNPDRGVYVSNLTEVLVKDAQAARRVFSAASANRTVARTSMNAASSRGHAVFQLSLESGVKLCVVDLAGRENERTTGCRGQSLAELGYINKSLFHLSSVIQALARPGMQGRVPFRDSKLTLLLSECLQSSRTSLVATVSPTSGSIEDTLTTMRLAQSVRQISTRSRRAVKAPESLGIGSFGRPDPYSFDGHGCGNCGGGVGSFFAPQLPLYDAGLAAASEQAPDPDGVPIPFVRPLLPQLARRFRGEALPVSLAVIRQQCAERSSCGGSLVRSRSAPL